MNKIHNLGNEIFPLQFPNRKLFRTPSHSIWNSMGSFRTRPSPENLRTLPILRIYFWICPKLPKMAWNGEKWNIPQNLLFSNQQIWFYLSLNKNIVHCNPSIIFLKAGTIVEIRTHFFVIQEQLYIYMPSVIYHI